MEKTIKEMLEAKNIEVKGEFDPIKFFEALARILSQEMGMEITVKATKKETEQQKKEDI